MAYRPIRFFCFGLLLTSCSSSSSTTNTGDDAGDAGRAGDAASATGPVSGGDDAGGETPPVPACKRSVCFQLVLLPGNYVTAASGKPIGAQAGTVPPDYGPPNLSGTVLELRDEASHAVIPSTTAFPDAGYFSTSSLVLTPNAPLPDAWYELAATSVPDAIIPPSPIRFHTGSHPIVRQLEYCSKGGNITRAVVGFSEPVKGATGAVQLEQDGKTSTYVQGIPGSEPIIECRDFTTAPVHLKVTEGLTSESGVPLTNLEGSKAFEITIDLTKLSTQGECLVWRP